MPPRQADAKMGKRGVCEQIFRRTAFKMGSAAVVLDKNFNWPASSLWGINWTREIKTETYINKMEDTNKILILVFLLQKISQPPSCGKNAILIKPNHLNVS